MKKVVTFGEIMMRLTAPDYKRFEQCDSLDITFGGGEANVAVALTNYCLQGEFVTKLPDNPWGQAAINHLRRYGVKTDNIVRGGDRIGTYYVEMGAAMRPSQVLYDRAGSAIAKATPDEFDYKRILEGAVWFHTTGISPALGDNVAEITENFLKTAKEMGITTSIDLNYRKKLWSSEKAISVMKKLCKYVDVCIGNEEDAEKTLGFKPAKTDVTKGALDIEGYKDIFSRMREEYGFKYIATTLRESHSAFDNGWSAAAYDGEKFYHTRKYNIHIVDRVGGGDSFASGFIYGLISEKSMEDAAEFASAASALKHTIPGDINHVTVQEVENLLKGDGSGRVQR